MDMGDNYFDVSEFIASPADSSDAIWGLLS
jgi:hypothetical protein